MKRFLILLLFAGVLSAQYVSILSTDYPANSLGILNSKPTMRQGAGAPSANCTASFDLYTNTTNNALYVCGPATNTWTLIAGSGTVTSVGFTGGLLSVGTPTTTPAFTVAGTSGGLPYFSSASTWASSAALTANLPVLGGGAGVAPTVGTRSGNTTAFVTTTGAQTSGDCVTIDANGNHVALGAACGSGGSGLVTWKLDGATIGSPRATVRLINGTGMAATAAEVGSQIEYTANVETAVIQSRATAQAGTSTYLRSTSGNDTYAGNLTPALAAYTRGGCILLDADTANTLTATVNVNTLGDKSILNRAGAALATGDITANAPITICYDGTQYIIQGDGGTGGGGSSTATAITTSTVAGLPGTCAVGDFRYVTDATVSTGGWRVYHCTATNTWSQFGYVAGGSGALTSSCTTLPCTIDITSVVVTKSGTNVMTGANDSSTASKTAPFRIGSADPGTCDATVREFFFNTTSNALKSCNTANTWTAITGSGSGNGYALPFALPGYGSVSMADSTVYYFGHYRGYGVFNQVETAWYKVRMTVPKTGTITAVTVDQINENTLPSSESVSYYIRKNDTTDTTLSTAINWSTGVNVSSTFTGLSIAVTAGDTIAFKVLTPAWATNPGAMGINGFIYID